MNERALAKLHKRRRAVRRRRLRRSSMGWVVTLLLTASALALVADRLMDPEAFAITEIEFEGEFQHLDPEHLNQVVTQAVKDNYFAIDLRQVEKVAETLDWVKGAKVRRVWPHGLHISIEEHKLAARWGDTGWLTQTGEVLYIDEVKADLIQLDGPADAAFEVLSQSKSWIPKLDALGLELKKLTLNERRAWRLRVSPLESDTVFDVDLGMANPVDRFKRFFGAYSHLSAEQIDRILRVDARYPHGFAIKLKPSIQTKETA